jgi:isocitrate dehydrogenase (NAD+)
MPYTVTLIPGDGSGPELAAEARRCIEATGASINWEIVDAGLPSFEKKGNPLPQEVLDSIAKNRVALKGPLTTPAGTGYRSINVQLRQYFELFACVRPCKTITGFRCALQNVDLVIIRENTEDLYAGIEFKEGDETTRKLIELVKNTLHNDIPADSGISLKPISRTATRRIAQFAFTYAMINNRNKITAVTKSNIMKFTDGLFYEEIHKISGEFPKIILEHIFVDNLCYQLVSAPQKFDILLAPNLYGDIVSDLCAGLVGGLGMAPSANIGDDSAIFEAVHGSAPKYAGKNTMNPCALILSGAMMLRYLGESHAADRLQNAVDTVVREGLYVTKDLNPQQSVGSREMADRIIHYLQ